MVNNKNYSIVFFLGAVIADIILKSICLIVRGPYYLGPFGFGALPLSKIQENCGLGCEGPFKNVTLLTICGFFVLYFMISLLITSKKHLPILCAFSLIAGGFVANGIDAAMHGSITRIFFINNLQKMPAIILSFNLADILVYSGFLYVLYFLYKSKDAIIADQKKPSRHYWIDKNFQTKYTLIICGLGLGFAFVSGLFSYAFLAAIINNVRMTQGRVDPSSVTLFTLLFLLITVAYGVVLLIFSRRITHNIAGPIFIFEKRTRELLAGKGNPDFKLRELDEFQNLQELYNLIAKAIQKKKQK